MSNKNATALPGKKLSKQQKLPTNYSNKYVKLNMLLAFSNNFQH